MSGSLDRIGGLVIADAPEEAIKSSLPPTQARSIRQYPVPAVFCCRNFPHMV
jgi:hypothetical protein